MHRALTKGRIHIFLLFGCKYLPKATLPPGRVAGAQSGWVVSIDDHPTVAIGDDAVHNAIIVKVKQSVAGTNVKEASFDFLATAKSETRNDREAVRRENTTAP
jgi:hypothetical protein